MSSRPPDARLRNARWRLRNSTWILPTLFFGLATWLSFFIVGGRTRRWDWIAAGAAYLVAAGLLVAGLAVSSEEAEGTGSTLLGLAILVAWFGGFVHALTVRRPYLRWLAAQPAGPVRVTAAEPIVSEEAGLLGFEEAVGDFVAAPAEEAVTAVDANTASREEINALPGIGTTLARRWVRERERRGGFRDLDDLAAALDLQPHVMVRLRPLVTFGAPQAQPTPRRRGIRRKGRVLDV